MQFLNKEIAILAKKKSRSLVKKQYSCGIFADLGEVPMHIAKKKQEIA